MTAPIDLSQAPGLLQFMGEGNQWFGPGTPLTPVAQGQTVGRAYDFATGYNYQTQPKPYEGVRFQDLRALADGYDLLRLVIETRKDQIEKLTWDIKKRGEKIVKKGAAPDARVEKIKDFLAYPDLEHPFGTWIRMLCEDLFVLDAPTVYNRRTKGGQPFSLELIDGATIKRILDPTGRTPLEGPAYQQVIKGVVACQYTREELFWMPRNPRTHRAFGFSPVEQIMTTVNIALRRQLHQLSYYTDGNTPNLIFGVPKEWTTDQIKKFQEWWDSLMVGNSAMRQRARFVPGEVKPVDTKEHALKDEYDEWLARIVCFAFSIPPTPLIKETNRATAQTVQKAALSEGLAPVMNWVKALMDRILRDCFGTRDLEFIWSEEQSMEPLVQSQRDEADITSGVRTVNECREDRGLEALPDPPPEPVLPTGAAVPPGKEPVAEAKPAPEAPKASKLAKAAKAAKKVKPIKRNRPALNKLEAKIKKTVATFLKAQVQPIAEAIHAAMPPTAEKMAKMSSDEAKQLLEASNIDWTSLGDDLETILASIAQDGVAQGLAQVGATTTADLLDQVNEQAVAWAEKHAADLVTKMAETTRAKLRGDLAASIELGMSVQDIAEVIGKDYSFSQERAELIATTERAFADVAGNMIAYRESGVVKGKQWILGSEHEDGAECDCEANAEAGVVDLDDNFPSGDDAAPAHPRCVCDVLPVLNDDTEEA
jgi:hypothetical protein